MTDLATLRTRLRVELRDQGSSFESSIVGNGAVSRFELPVDLVNSSGLVVTRNGAAITNPSGYTMDYLNGVITLVSPLPDGQTLFVTGTYYDVFLDSELDSFIGTAFGQHTNGRTTSNGIAWTYADLPGVEDYLVVLLALVQAFWVLATDSSRDINITVPDGVVIPEAQRFQQVMGMIQARQLQYDHLAQQLNVGLSRIQMSDLRRVSRTTNRLVPIYKEREFDDNIGEFNPPAGAVGSTVYIYGKNFTGATAVAFHGTPVVTFAVVSDTLISAVVPVGATSGVIAITTPASTVTTNAIFTVGALPASFRWGPDRLYPPIDPFES